MLVICFACKVKPLFPLYNGCAVKWQYLASFCPRYRHFEDRTRYSHCKEKRQEVQYNHFVHSWQCLASVWKSLAFFKS